MAGELEVSGGLEAMALYSQMCDHTQNWAQLKTQLFKVVGGMYIYMYIPRTQMTPMFEGQPSQKQVSFGF